MQKEKGFKYNNKYELVDKNKKVKGKAQVLFSEPICKVYFNELDLS